MKVYHELKIMSTTIGLSIRQLNRPCCLIFDDRDQSAVFKVNSGPVSSSPMGKEHGVVGVMESLTERMQAIEKGVGISDRGGSDHCEFL